MERGKQRPVTNKLDNFGLCTCGIFTGKPNVIGVSSKQIVFTSYFCKTQYFPNVLYESLHTLYPCSGGSSERTEGIFKIYTY